MKFWEKEIFGRKLRIENGKMAKQSHGSILLTFNESTILLTVNASETAKPGTDFLPLTVDFKEKFYAIGKIPGGFVKREGRPSEEAILSSRLIDRPIRPLFPKDFHNEIQVISTVFSMLNDDSIETWSIAAASLALNISPIPFNGVVAGVRVGLIDGEYIAFPTQEQLSKSEIDIVVAGSKEAITMVEGEAHEVSEEIMVEALNFSHKAIKEIISIQEEIISEFNIEKWEVEVPEYPEEFINDFKSLINKETLFEALMVEGKKNKDKKLKEFKDSVFEEFEELYLDKWTEEFYLEKKSYLKETYEEIFKKLMRRSIVDDNKRADGRKIDEIRPITCEIGVIPRVHGSALFTRGETQSLGITTLGAPMDVQMVDTIFSDEDKRFMLHYNFPPFSTGEVRPLRGPGRREIGHGHLAERSHKNLIPSESEFPYTIRVVSEILESNGSSSMATVCSASLSMMDAGIPLKKHVAGVAMGLIFEEDKNVVLTDILGIEDHLGDMDFKVTGTREGITAFQMDVKVDKVNEEIMREALDRAKIARLKILNLMYDAISEPRPELSPFVPKIKTITIPVNKIGDVIGPGGRIIKKINETYNTETSIDDEGIVKVSGMAEDMVDKAIKYITGLVSEIEKGKVYEGKIKRVEKYGVFVEVLPGKSGLLHISNMSKKPTELKIDDKINVEVISIESQSKFQLKEEGYEKPKRAPRPEKTSNDKNDSNNDEKKDKDIEKENGGN
ncbi:polyribonucleotide nucleotidyltransferase [Oceanotoga sp. DSM 15011]|uniref:polyribonucleotide nucleotidyltransferase n=1 Tax=Oceanotoga sp. DSM 15011 TaxID=2984951 RepID=UPI0021F409C4|nr:polyribonucleotide nucleotidyltransferase [Oceanotoga sp. DSM 15011]UYP00746.1 polyribonucleotide nucleotidyltransferase [Oceanotoga sp. DSM 15011]